MRNLHELPREKDNLWKSLIDLEINFNSFTNSTTYFTNVVYDTTISFQQLNNTYRNMYRNEISIDNPISYWQLGETNVT